MPAKCDAITKAGSRCKTVVLPGRSYCFNHDPAQMEARNERNRKGGEQRSDARRAIKAWAAFGKELDSQDLPLILKSCMAAVRTRKMSPGEASAIANLAKTAVQIEGDLQLEARIEALERAAGMVSDPPNVRRMR